VALLHRWDDVRIGVEGDRDVCVPEDLRDHLGVLAGLEGQRRPRMREVVESDAWDETEALLLELKAFERHRTERAHLIFGARSGPHDDLVIALALAVLEDPGVFSMGPRVWS